MGLTRRAFVAGTAAIPFAVWLEQNAWAAGPFIRSEARSTAGKAMLKIYAGAVKKMMTASSIPTGSPQSWTFQWYTHFVKGDTTKNAALAAIYPTPSAWKTLATEMWNTCQAHSGQPEEYFLPWHRMFVYFFESIIRKVSGNATFALPYWNYSIGGPAHGVIPPEFTKSGDATYGSLFVKKRNTGVNTGTPIDEDDPGALDLTALAQCTYLPVSAARAGFNMTLDRGLHGNVHGLVGNNQNMGSVPWAAGDPIFWMHHCNIDRLWASWNKGGRKNPTTTAFLNKTFVFADGGGNRVVATIKDFLDIAPLNYTYDRFEPIPACPPSLTDSAPTVTKIGSAGSLNLSAAPARKPVTVTMDESLPAHVSKLPAGKRLFVVIRNLSTNVQPGVIYHVYLELPAATPAAKGREFQIGTINFFDAEHAMHGGADQSDRFISFDITDLAKQLRAKNLLTATPVITIAPIRTPSAEAKPVVGDISLVEE